MVKQCNKCGEVKEIGEFQKRKFKSGNEGYYSACKKCRKPLIAKGHLKNKKLHPIYIKACLHCNKVFATINQNQIRCSKKCLPMTELRKDKIYLELHPEINRKEYFKDKNKKKFSNPEYRKQLMSDPVKKAEYKAKAKLSRVKYKKEHRTEINKKKYERLKIRLKDDPAYKEKYIERRRIYFNSRINNDINFKLKKRISTKVYLTLRGSHKYIDSLSLLGCSIQDARNHIERQFINGMSWDNWGLHGWHIDHIVPIDYFDLTDIEQQKRCFNYTNLQPLWAKDNLKKSNNIIETQLKLL